MTLHCAGRLGVLSYLYQNKSQIAHTLGLIAEVPIAFCSSDYDFDSGLIFQSNDDSSSTPPVVLQVSEVQLFITDRFNFQVPDRQLLSELHLYAGQQKVLSRPPQPIFQPPAVS
jgi:hypothetical protein